MEIRQAILIPTWNAFYVQLEMGLSHLGPKGGKEIQNTSHTIWGVQRQYSWENSASETTLGGSTETGWRRKLGPTDLRLGMGYTQNYLIEEAYARASLHAGSAEHDAVSVLNPQLAFHGSIKLARLFDSSYASIQSYRLEGSMKLALWHIWQPSCTITSAFVDGDSGPQIHLSPFDIYWAL
jgi:hypothetical protein